MNYIKNISKNINDQICEIIYHLKILIFKHLLQSGDIYEISEI